MAIDSTANGFEMDVYFDVAKNNFFVYHDSSAMSATSADEIFAAAEQRKMNASIWLDFKNLDEQNKAAALQKLGELQKRFGLAGKILVESANASPLRYFCDSGFFTSYYVPFFNPYTEDENPRPREGFRAGILEQNPYARLWETSHARLNVADLLSPHP